MRNRPVVSTAKVRGIVKKSGIGYVDATRRYYPSIANGISVWQLGSHVLFAVFGDNSEQYLATFQSALSEHGLTFEQRAVGSAYEIKAVAA